MKIVAGILLGALVVLAACCLWIWNAAKHLGI